MVKKKETLEKKGNDVILGVKVKPNSHEFKIGKVNRWTGLLEIKLSKQAKKGKANKELVKKLKERLDKDLKIKRGRKSDKKVIIIYNCSKEKIKKNLLPDN